MDEAASSLEVATETRILSNLRAAGATAILIAHCPEEWALADRIFSFDQDGNFTEEGAVGLLALTS